MTQVEMAAEAGVTLNGATAASHSVPWWKVAALSLASAFTSDGDREKQREEELAAMQAQVHAAAEQRSGEIAALSRNGERTVVEKKQAPGGVAVPKVAPAPEGLVVPQSAPGQDGHAIVVPGHSGKAMVAPGTGRGPALAPGAATGISRMDASKGQVETPHYRGDRAAPETWEPNSIWETQYPDGKRRVTYFDEHGRPFSREDYGQKSRHLLKIEGRRVDLKNTPHEHQTRTLQGPNSPYHKKQVRLLDQNGMPASGWVNEK